MPAPWFTWSTTPIALAARAGGELAAALALLVSPLWALQGLPPHGDDGR